MSVLQAFLTFFNSRQKKLKRMCKVAQAMEVIEVMLMR